MLRSMFAGVSGLSSHQERMDVIGDNIANVNTIGYKGSNVNFAEMMAQTEQAATAPRAERGGINPQQVGMGVQVSSINTDITQGSLESTGVPTDAAIEGDGYFVVSDGTQNMYTRNGAFEVDASGHLVNSAQGFRVQGWSDTLVREGEIVVDNDTAAGDIDINIGEPMPEGIDLYTTEATVDGNLDTRISEENWLSEHEADTYGWVEEEERFVWHDGDGEILYPHHTSTFDIFDAQGQRHRIAMDFTKNDQTEDQSEWNVQIRLDDLERYSHFLDEDGEIENHDDAILEGLEHLVFDNEGRLDFEESALDDDDGIFETSYVDLGLTDRDEFKMETPDEPIGLDINFAEVMQQADDSTAEGYAEDGYEPGVLNNFSIETDGTIVGQYTNGLDAPIGQIALADFENPAGLLREGGSLFLESANSGEASIGVAGTGGRGEIEAGALEMSNVDLAEEFTEMIRTQRGFQGNSTSIETSDEMLQELVNLAR